MFANVVLIISNQIIMQKTFRTFTVAIRRYGHHLVTIKTPNMSTNCIREYTYISLVLISGDFKIVETMLNYTHFQKDSQIKATSWPLFARSGSLS